jgi:hypothetical protein
MTTMQRKHDEVGVVLQVDPSMFPRRIVAKRSSAPIASPQNLTVSVPARHLTTVKNSSTWQPPQEIIIGGGGDDVQKKLPKTIKVKDAFCPPSVVVIGDKHGRGVHKNWNTYPIIKGVPTIIQVQETPPRTIGRSQRGTDQGVPSLPRTSPPVHKKKEVPADAVVTLTEAAKSVVPALTEESAVLQPAETIVAESELPPSTLQEDGLHMKKERRPSPDPRCPSKKLPDFSAMAKQRLTDVGPQRRRNILSIPNNSSGTHHSDQGYGPLSSSQAYMTQGHESWPRPTANNRRTSNIPGTSSRVPQWLGVTGNAEDWIRATKRDDILEVGRKIAQHRIPDL